MNKETKRTIQMGLLAGVISLSLSTIGMVETFAERNLVTGVLTMGHILLFLAPMGFSRFIVKELDPGDRKTIFSRGALIGFLASLPVVGLAIFVSGYPDIRTKLINLSPHLIEFILFGQSILTGILLLVITSIFVGLIGAGYHALSPRIQNTVATGSLWTLGISLFAETLRGTPIITALGQGFIKAVIKSKGLAPIAAVIIFIISAGITYWWHEKGNKAKANFNSRFETPSQQKSLKNGRMALGVIFLLAIPFIAGTFLTEVIDNVGLFILMGLGLNIVVGFAGLLDLGYVAFFAIGAYTVGLLTSQGELGLGIAGMNFWIAVPIAAVVSVIAGVLLGTPVLRLRGDYLAIVTLGFGEIIRVLAFSDVLKPVIGGAQGVLQIPKPELFEVRLYQPEQLFYIILLGCLTALFISMRLRDSRLGRQWMAMREDEDVAEAMGINLVNTKLLAFGIGAGLSGLAGAIFASKLGTIYPSSFDIVKSILILSLIIVGGIGSLPGVIIGAFVLVGLPELLREFVEYRQLMFGALLIVMMLAKPEGLWPSQVHKRELQANEEGPPDPPIPETAEAGSAS